MVKANLYFLSIFLCPLAGAQETDDSLRTGQILQSEGRFIEAERVLQRAVSVAMSSATANVQVATLSNLASVQLDLSQFGEAAQTYRKATIILLKDPYATRDRVRTLQLRSAEVYLEAGQIEIAERLVLPLITTQFGNGSPVSSDAYALDLLACIYAAKNRLAEAEASERRSLAINQKLIDAEPTALAIGTLHLANFMNRNGKSAEALPYALQALGLFVSLALPNPGMRASAEINLASIYSRTGHIEEARKYSAMAELTAEQHYGSTDRRTALMLLGQAAVLRAIGDKKPARAAQKRAEFILNAAPQLNNTVPLDALFSK